MKHHDQNKAFQAWQATMMNRANAMKAQNIDWTKLKLDPSKLAVEMGPALTEEQFKAYCKNAGTKPHIIKK